MELILEYIFAMVLGSVAYFSPKFFRFFTVYLIIMLGFMLVPITTNAQEVTMTAEVHWNCQNIHTTTMPAPEISHTWENEWGYNFIGWIGSSPFYALRTQDRLTFYLDDAVWYTDGYQVIYETCDE